MAVIVTILAYGLQLGALLLLPALLFGCLRRHKNGKASLLISLLCTVVIFSLWAWVAHHPVRSCPEELEFYITEDRWQDILSVTPPFFNTHLPFFPWRVTVERADEKELYWRTDWFPVGTTRTGITPDGYDPVHGLR